MNTSKLVAALEDAWKRIASVNADVPDSVILVGSGGRRAATLYGHFARDSWSRENADGGGETVHEVLIVAEQLNRPAKDIFTTLLHEAVHGIAASREIKDVSGQRHNRKFAMLCEEAGLLPPERPDQKIGWSAATLLPETEALFAPEIEAIEEQLKAVRRLNFKKKETKKTTWIASCECERKIRIPKKAISDPKFLMIDCGVCGFEFELEPDDLQDFIDV
jgi:hypothetical protein